MPGPDAVLRPIDLLLADAAPVVARAAARRKVTPESFAPIVRATSSRLYRVAARILGSAADAQDAVQDAYVRAYDALRQDRYDERLRMEAWLVTIVTRICIDVLRARKVRADEGARTATAPRQVPDAQENQALALMALSRWLETLPPDQRAAIVLRFMEGMTSAEVGVALGISEGAVEQRILRARATLRKQTAL